MNGATCSRVRGRFATWTIALFSMGLSAPRIDEFLRDADERGPAVAENRRAGPWPGAVTGFYTARAWPNAFTQWFEDRMGLRDVFLRHKSLVHVRGFGVSPTDTVLLGNEGMLFFRGDHTIEIHRGLRPFSATELDRFARWFEYRDAWCRARGMRYMLVIGPNKETIYPELLPEWCSKVGPTRLEQLRAYLAEKRSTVELVDLTDAMRAARALEAPRRRVYSVLGTHWDGLGMWTAYREVASRLANDYPAVRPLDWEELARMEYSINHDSWAAQMYIQDAVDQFSTVVTVPAERTRRTVVLTQQGLGTRGRSRVPDAALPRIWVNHDSFGTLVLDLLAEHASNAATVFDTRFEFAEIEANRPDVVIDWYVERIFDHWKPTPDGLPPIGGPVPRAEPRYAWRLEADQVNEALRAFGAASIELVTHSPLELAVRLDSTADGIELPVIELPHGSRASLHARIEGPGVTECDLFFRLEDGEYRRKQVRTASVPARGGRVEFELEPEWLRAPLRLRPGRLPGTYFVSELAIVLDPGSPGGSPR